MGFKGLTVTYAGERLTAEAMGTGKSVMISKACIGDGVCNTNFKDQQNIVNKLFELLPTKNTEKNKIYLNMQINNDSYSRDFYFREIAIYAKDSSNNDVLFAYDNAGAEAEFIQIKPDIKYEKALRFCIGFSGDLKIDIVIPGSLYMLKYDALSEADIDSIIAGNYVEEEIPQPEVDGMPIELSELEKIFK